VLLAPEALALGPVAVLKLLSPDAFAPEPVATLTPSLPCASAPFPVAVLPPLAPDAFALNPVAVLNASTPEASGCRATNAFSKQALRGLHLCRLAASCSIGMLRGEKPSAYLPVRAPRQREGAAAASVVVISINVITTATPRDRLARPAARFADGPLVLRTDAPRFSPRHPFASPCLVWTAVVS